MKKVIIALGAMSMSFQSMASGTVLINGNEIKTQEHLHTVLSKQLNFPTSYGKNLDSLYDMLSTDFSGTTIIKIKHLNTLKARLGADFMDALVHTTLAASQDNSKIVLVVE